MIAFDASIVDRLVWVVGIGAAQCLALLHNAREYPKDKFIVCGSITTILFIVTIAVLRIQNVPDWLVSSLLFFMYSFCVVSIFLLLQEGYRAVRRRYHH